MSAMSGYDARLLLLHPKDNVLVLVDRIEAGEILRIEQHQITLAATLGLGHKVARCAIRRSEKVIKYGVPIGSATSDIAVGEHVHTSNLHSDYTRTYSLEQEGATRVDGGNTT